MRFQDELGTIHRLRAIQQKITFENQIACMQQSNMELKAITVGKGKEKEKKGNQFIRWRWVFGRESCAWGRIFRYHHHE